nr:hypothetical protein [Tanacetum cinerariifolium]
YKVPRKKRLYIVFEESTQSKVVEDDVDSEETEVDEEALIRKRPTGVVIGGEDHRELNEEALYHSKKPKEVERMSETAKFFLQLRQAKKVSKQEFILQQRPRGLGEGSGVTLEVSNGLHQKSLNEGSGVTLAAPDEPSSCLSSSNSDSDDAVEDISSDDENDRAIEKEKAKAKKTKEEHATEDHIMTEQARIEQPKNVQAKEMSLTDVLKEPKVEVQSLVNVLVLQPKSVEQRPPLVDTTITLISKTTLLPKQPPETKPKRSKTKVLLKKSEKPETQVDTDDLDTSVTKLEKMVNAMSRFHFPEEIDKSVKAHLKNILPKDVPNFGKIKLKKAAKKSMSKYSTTPFDQATLNKFDQKDKLFKIMSESKSYNKQPTHKALDVKTIKFKIQRKQKDLESSKKNKDQAGSSKKGKSPFKSSKTDTSVHADETVHDIEMKTGESVKDDVLDAKNLTQADASAPKQDKSTWFKTIMVERYEYPNPKWHKEPTIDDAPEQTWFNEMVNAVKNQQTFDDVMGSVIDLSKFTKNCLKKDKIMKKRVEDVQLGVECYQRKHNLTRPHVRCAGLDDKEPYTIIHKPRGVVYLNKDEKKYLMSEDELYKFGYKTLKKEQTQRGDNEDALVNIEEVEELRRIVRITGVKKEALRTFMQKSG